MIVFYPPHHLLFKNLAEVENGSLSPSPEVPERVETITSALRRSGYFEFRKPEICSERLIAQVHRSDYIDFLKNESNWRKLEFPSVFNYTNQERKPSSSTAKKGYYFYDTFTPLTKNLWQAAYESASCAVAASNVLLRGEKAVYALCRPPGHHACSTRAGGYCYLNNTAIAAVNLLNHKAKKIAILDIDFHHGNGTQEIFYSNNRVLTISLHADPGRRFPYFSGFVSEQGKGRGRGFNFNFPLPAKIKDREYLSILQRAIDIIDKFSPAYLIVSVGFDTYEKDPICDFQISFEGFSLIGSTIAGLLFPILLVQEGGYYLPDLGRCAFHFLKPFLQTIKK